MKTIRYKNKKVLPDASQKDTQQDTLDNLEKSFPGYPHYRGSEDIYNRFNEESDIDQKIYQEKKKQMRNQE